MSEKPTICLLTNWYPTEENPYRGLFFREQALAMEGMNHFLVIHYTERIRKFPWQRDQVIPVKREGNIEEYTLEARVPLRLHLADRMDGFFAGHPGGVKGYAERSPRRDHFKERKLKQLMEKHFVGRADAFYCVDAQREAADVRMLAKHSGKPCIVGEHGPVPWPGYVIPERQKRAVEEADAFLAISRDKMRQLMMQGIRLPRTVYIGNLVDETRFALKKKEGAAGQETAGSGEDVRTFLTVGAHSFYKNYDLFIAVMNRLTEMTPVPFRVLIVGYGANKGYSRDAEELEKKIAVSRFAERAEMIPVVPHGQMAEIYHRADAFVMTSVQEGQPVSALEAACCGLPVFSTRCGGVEDYVDADVGRIVDVTDGEALALALKDFLEGRISFDPVRIREKVVGMYGRVAFRAHFAEAFEQADRQGETGR